MHVSHFTAALNTARRNSVRILLPLVSVLFLLSGSSSAAAEARSASQLKLTTEKVIVFKDGVRPLIPQVNSFDRAFSVRHLSRYLDRLLADCDTFLRHGRLRP